MILNVDTTSHFVQLNSLIACFDGVGPKKEINVVWMFLSTISKELALILACETVYFMVGL